MTTMETVQTDPNWEFEQSKAAVRTAGALILVVTLASFLIGAIWEGFEAEVFGNSVNVLVPLIIDGGLALALLAGKPWARTWTLIRMVGGALLFGASTVAAGTYADSVLQIGYSASIVLLLTGQSTKVRIAAAVGLLVVSIPASIGVAAATQADVPWPKVGECFDLPDGSGESIDAADLQLVPCSEPHMFEAFAVVGHDGDTYPGELAVASEASAGCAGQFEEYVGIGWFEAGYDVTAFSPDASGWGGGDRDSRCSVSRLDGELATQSARSSGSIVPPDHVSFFLLNEGDCADETAWAAFALPVSCDGPHDMEVYAVLTNPEAPDAPFPALAGDELASLAFETCGRAFAARVGDIGGELFFGPLTFPNPLSWSLGDRRYVCALSAAVGRQLTGSKTARTGLADAGGTAFTGEPDLSYPDFSSVAGLAFVGSAQQAGTSLWLTEFAEHRKRGVPIEQERPQRGAVWSGEKVPVAHGFETTFVFQLEHYSWFTIGDGFAFVIQNAGEDAIGDAMGYNRLANSVAVEFDTLLENWMYDPGTSIPDAPSLLANHVSVQTNGRSMNDIAPASSLGWANLEPIALYDRGAHVALIRYEPGELSVFVDDLDTPVLIVEVDLEETIRLDEGAAYVGFTASSGPHSYTGPHPTIRGPETRTITGHKIHSWLFAGS